MSTGKYLLGTAAIVGGVYYYDQFVQPILPRKQHEQLNKTTNRIDKDSNRINDKLSDKIEQGKNLLQEKKEALKDTKLYKNFTNDDKKVDELKYFARENTTPDDDKSVLKKSVQKYIDFINCLGEGKYETERTPYSSMGELEEVKEKPIFGGLFNKKDEVKDKAEAKKNEWSNWGSKELDQAQSDAEAKKNEWSSWANKKLDQAQSDAEAKKNEWSNWGSKKADELKDDAETKKNQLSNWTSEKTDQTEAKKNELTSWGSKKLDEASKDLDSKEKEWSNWGSAKATEAQREAEKQKKSWFNWGSKKADEAEQQKNDIVDWSQAKVDEASNNLNKQFNSTKSDVENQWNQAKDSISDRYLIEKDRAIKSYEEAKSKFEELSNSLRNDPHKEEKLQRAKRDASSSLENLRLYGDDVYNEFKSKVNDLFK
ncbi:unnamed protein product [Candida verbasci]|uniref:37 kDa cell surface protein n=1 Tax=Candida verbasci TaxID=1227364 RepID=A0A9W4TSF1_9ASCO|nr:unnamed protein product [Candida verbasci]